MKKIIIVLMVCFVAVPVVPAGDNVVKFRVVAFYKAKNDQAHISFVREANKWFSSKAVKYNFAYEATDDWSKMNPEFLTHCDVVVFLDARPEPPSQRMAFEEYIKNGGRWKNDLRTNPDIKILVSIDPASFPLGTGPKQDEIWYSGYYPVVWTNVNYKMLYINMGHNDIDYENNTGLELSSTFAKKVQNRLILDALLWLGRGDNH